MMTAYNKVNGTYCGEQPDLIGRCCGASGASTASSCRTGSARTPPLPAALAGLDLEMPGPPAWFGPSLAAAVRDGLVDESVVDGQVRHLLRLMGRVGLSEGRPPPGEEREEDDPGRRALARTVAAEGTVLLVNDGLLPLSELVSSVAVVGPERGPAGDGGRQLGGDAAPAPQRGRRRWPSASRPRWSHEVGCRIDRGLPADRPALLLDGEGCRMEYFDAAVLRSSGGGGGGAHARGFLWIGPPQPGLAIGACSVRTPRRRSRPTCPVRWRLRPASAGRAVLRLDGADGRGRFRAVSMARASTARATSPSR